MNAKQVIAALLIVGCGGPTGQNHEPCIPGDRRCAEDGTVLICAIKAALCDHYDGGPCVIVQPQEDYAWRPIGKPGTCNN